MSDAIPCVKLPSLSGIPKIPLLGGAELRGLVDLSLGPPSDCRLNFNLLVQLTPFLANFACVIKVMNVFAKVKDFASAPPDVYKLADAGVKVVDSITELEGCMPALAIPNMLAMLKAILLLILGFLNCLVSQIQSVLQFQASIDVSAAEGNDVLQQVLQCAHDNADTSMETLKQSIEPIQPLIQMVTTIAGIAGHPITIDMPDLSSVSAGADASEAVQPLVDMIATLHTIVEAIPG